MAYMSPSGAFKTHQLLEEIKMAILNQDNPALEEKKADESVPFDITLAVADTSEEVATVPAGKAVRSVTLINENGAQSVFVNYGAAAAVTDVEVGPRKQLVDLDLDVSSVEFIGEAGETPTVRGYLLVGPA